MSLWKLLTYRELCAYDGPHEDKAQEAFARQVVRKAAEEYEQRRSSRPNFSEMIERQLSEIWQEWGVLPTSIEAAPNVAQNFYHFRPSMLDGVTVVIDADLLPGHAILNYNTPKTGKTQ